MIKKYFARAFACAFLVAAFVLPAACTFAPPDTSAPVVLRATTFKNLSGWAQDPVAAALPAFARSCARILKRSPDAPVTPGQYAGAAALWQDACAALPDTGADDATARAYFETWFTPYAVYGDTGQDKGRNGLFTGYYEPELRGSLTKQAPYLYPLYTRPADMLTVDLGAFSAELKGKTITGRIDGQKLVPYHSRADIENGALETPAAEQAQAAPEAAAAENAPVPVENAPVIVWVDSAVDAFFLHIQGSGKVTLDTGDVMHLGYAAQNGHAYTAVGKILLEKGALEKGKVSMQSIRAWLEAHPDQAAEIMNANASYVFFRQLDGDGPLGAEGVALTPERSLAVDRTRIPYGTPVWIDAAEPENGPRLQRLMIAQDTGGAIRGAVRGDYFWGAGDRAAHKAGLMQSRGQMWLLLPRGVTVPDAGKWRWWHDISFGRKTPTHSGH